MNLENRNFDHIDPQEYEAVKISLASPEKIREWSYGEVKIAETINYRTDKPERNGLFCGKIFGPVVDYECICGKYKRRKHRGIRCEKCGVEVIASNVRRERMGHIEMACPVTHIWFMKSVPNRLAILLDIAPKDLRKVVYYHSFLVIEAGETNYQVGDVIDEDVKIALQGEDRRFKAEIGAEAVAILLNKLNLPEVADILKEELLVAGAEAKRKKIIKRLKIVEVFKKSNIAPSSMVLTVIPVIPPDLRPLVPLEGGRFATSELNDFYRRIIHRNNRLKKLLGIGAPSIIIRNEQRILQEAVDALFDNSKMISKPILGSSKRPLKSLSDSLKGKYGRFRQNLLGKRVDYSGRSVIVVGPDLKLNQCGLPKQMALELFKPFVFHQLMKEERVRAIREAKKLIEENDPIIWEVLDKVVDKHPVILNRAPTLHKLGIQSFEPILVEGKAIHLHPLVCAAFNADFDGDQMAVHIPVSLEAQVEAKVLLSATNNILSPATGMPIMVPSQDMVLGLYWMTKDLPDRMGEGKIFPNIESAIGVYEQEAIDLHALINVRINNKICNTTIGRVILYDVLPRSINFEEVNKTFRQADIKDIVIKCYNMAGNVETVKLLDKFKDFGFKYATESGISICMKDMVIPDNKTKYLQEAEKKTADIYQQFQSGIITEGERYNKVVDVWSETTEIIGKDMLAAMQDNTRTMEERGVPINALFAMVDSGARGSTNQNRQLGGMRGLMSKPSGEIIETPITANFREGLGVHQYFISTHGARKGLADTALKTARSGYLTRRLVDVSQDSIISVDDCGTNKSIVVEALVENGEVVEKLTQRILGRMTADEVLHPRTQEILIEKNIMLDETNVSLLDEAAVMAVAVRSVLVCEANFGICVKCYGRDLSNNSLVKIGVAVGVIAAQSIGEPGTQLTMRTFHIGGAASRQVERTSWIAEKTGTFDLKDVKFVENKEGFKVVINRKSEARILDENNYPIERLIIPMGSKLFFKDKQLIKAADKIAEWDPFSVHIISDIRGIVKYHDVVEGESMKRQTDVNTGISREVIIDNLEHDLKPAIRLKSVDTKRDLKSPDGNLHRGFDLPIRAEIVVPENSIISPGDTIAKIPKESSKNKDITGGLPRVIDLLEAREPKEKCVISDIDGRVQYGGHTKKKREIIIVPEAGESKKYLVPRSRYIIVLENEEIKAGEALTDGSPNPHDILEVKGLEAVQKYLVNEVLEVYRSQGVKINDKHVEVIVRHMLQKVEIISSGDTTFLGGEIISKKIFQEENKKTEKQGLRKAEAKPKLLGVMQAALRTDSFLSSASFQETTKILTDASINGKLDYFQGLKENVIAGRLIAAGTGYAYRQKNYRYKVTDKNIPILGKKAIEGNIEEEAE